MTATVLTGSGLDIDVLARVARGGDGISLAAEARARVAAARAVVERAAAGERPIYGLNTGLGGNLKHRLAPDEITAFQMQFVVGRAIGVGEPLPRATCARRCWRAPMRWRWAGRVCRRRCSTSSSRSSTAT